jgi:hypothetical protein
MRERRWCKYIVPYPSRATHSYPRPSHRPRPERGVSSGNSDKKRVVDTPPASDGGQLRSDGGPWWLSAADAALGLYGALAAGFPDWRTGSVRHSLETLVRKRVF